MHDFTETQIDILKEVGNIGMGNAATALSKMLDRMIDMKVPNIDIVLFNDVGNKVGAKDDIVISVLLKVDGEAPGSLLFVVKESDAKKIFDVLMEGLYTKDEEGEVFLSVFQEIGNILGNAYINAVSQFVGMDMVCSVPSVSQDMLGAVISSSLIASGQVEDYVIELNSNLVYNEVLSDLSIVLFFIPEPKSMNKILSQLVI